MASQIQVPYHLYFVMPSVYVQKLLVLPQFVWLCGRDTDGSTTIIWEFPILGTENILSMILVAEIGWNRLKIDFLDK